MNKLFKLEPGDVLLVPTYYYSMPYQQVQNQIEINAQKLLDGMIKQMEKFLGKQAKYQIMTLVPPTAKYVSTEQAKQVVQICGQKYIHSELYLGRGWVISAGGDGTKLIKYQPSAFQVFDIVRFDGLDVQKTIAAVDKYWNLPYDYASLGINQIAELLGQFGKFVGYEDLELKVEDFFHFDNPKAMICSELVQRLLQEGGVKFDQFEFISPQDLADRADQRLL